MAETDSVVEIPDGFDFYEKCQRVRMGDDIWSVVTERGTTQEDVGFLQGQVVLIGRSGSALHATCGIDGSVSKVAGSNVEVVDVSDKLTQRFHDTTGQVCELTNWTGQNTAPQQVWMSCS